MGNEEGEGACGGVHLDPSLFFANLEHGYMDTWIHGHMDTWIHGYMVRRALRRVLLYYTRSFVFVY